MSKAIHIVNAESSPGYLEELRSLFLEEWEDIDPFHGNQLRDNPPAPMLALEDGELLGGLSFTWYQPQDFTEIKLWINGVYVKPDYRGKGIASSLIKNAMAAARSSDEEELFVFTAIPGLYTQLAWQEVSRQGKNYVLKTSLT